MPIKYVRGNVFDSQAKVIFHGANCFCTMNSGLAKEMRERYPEAYRADLQTPKGDLGKLGTTSYTHALKDNRILVNLYTQYRYGLDKCHLDYYALDTSLQALKDRLSIWKILDEEIVASGRIGAGRAGGDWKLIEEIIENVFNNRAIHIYDL
jgi:O-acetyl-ADP-ribose deacetylase (regulator of RNase III)